MTQPEEPNEDLTAALRQADEIAKAVRGMTLPKLNLPEVKLPVAQMTAVQAMLGGLAKNAIHIEGLIGPQPGAMAALTAAASLAAKSDPLVSSSFPNQNVLAAMRTMGGQKIAVTHIPVNPMIGMAREQIELQEDANEALDKVIRTLEVELAESRRDAARSRRDTKIALIVAAAGVIVSIVLGVAALIK